MLRNLSGSIMYDDATLDIELKMDGCLATLPGSINMEHGGIYTMTNDTLPSRMPNWLFDVFKKVIEDADAKKGKRSDNAPDSGDMQDALYFAYQKIPDILDHFVCRGVSNDSILTFDGIDYPTPCPICPEGEHGTDGGALYLTVSKKYVTARCHHSLEGSLCLGAYGLTINAAMKRKDDGLADYFADEARTELIVYGRRQGSCYAWNDKMALWLDGDEGSIADKVPGILGPSIEGHIGWLRGKGKTIPSVELMFDPDALKAWNGREKAAKRVLDRVRTLKGMHDIASIAKIRMAESERIKLIDSVDHLLPIKGGLVINLKTGIPRLRAKEDYFSWETPIGWTDNADIAAARDFMTKLMCGDAEETACLQRILGYSLFGGNPEQKLWIHYGPTAANGKSTLMKILSAIIGEGYLTIDRSVFVNAKNATIDAGPHMARLKGKRIATCLETEDGDTMNVAILKSIAGLDNVTAKALYKDPIDFAVKFVLNIVTNNYPQVDKSADEGLLRKIAVIEYSAKFLDRNMVRKDVAGEYEADLRFANGQWPDHFLEGMLKWIVEGAMIYSRDGLKLTDKVNSITTKYKQQLDTISRFIDDMLAPTAIQSERLLAKEIHSLYSDWAKGEDAKPMTVIALGRELTKRRYDKKHTVKGQTYGLRQRKTETDNEAKPLK